MRKLFFISIFIFSFITNIFAGQVIVQSQQTFESMTPATLTAYKALSFINADSMAISAGSAIGSSLTVSETIDSNNGSICVWYYPYNYGNAGQTRYLFDCYVDANNRVSLYINASNDLVLDVIGAGTTRTASTSFASIKPFTWNHIVATWSKNVDVNATNNSYIYLNGSGAGQTSATVAMASLPSSFYIGSDYNSKQSANGLIAYKIMRYWMSEAQVTADYNSGSGSLEFFTRTPHTIAMGLTSENSTGVVYVHRGKAVSAIVDGATEDTLTTSAGSDTSFADNDRVIVSDGMGYASNRLGNAFIDGTPSSTSANIDDGADADLGLVEKVGVNINFAGVYNATGGNIHSVSTNDFCLSIWIKSGTPVADCAIISKGLANDKYYAIRLRTTGVITSYLRYSATKSASTTSRVDDNKWHHIAVTFDRDGNAQNYVDGYANGSASDISTENDNISTSEPFRLGAYGSSTPSLMFTGYIANAKIYIGGLWSADEILYQARNPFDYGASAGTLTDYWKCTDGSGTTVVGNVNNLTLSNALAWNQSAFLSRNLIVDGDLRNGGIGAWSRLSGATLAKNSTTPISDEQDLKITNSGAAQGSAGQVIPTAAGEDFYLYGLVKGPATVNGASQLVDVDATASLGMTATQAWLTAGVTSEVELCFEAGDTSTTIDFGTGSVTNAEIAYWDNLKLFANMVNNGGCEGGADPPTSWTQEANATVVSDTSPHAGTNCLKATAGADNVGAKQNVSLVSGQYYTIIGYAKATAGDSARIIVDTGDTTLQTIGTVTATTWTRVRGSFKATGTAGVVYLKGVTNTDVVWFDDIAILRDDVGSVTATKGNGILPENMPALIR